MSELVVDDLGAAVEWRVRQGCVWRLDFESVIDGVPEDITGATIAARVTASSTSSTALKTFTVTKTVATAGKWSIAVAEAAADLAPGAYWWACEIDNGLGDEPVCSGVFTVEAWVVS
jgi:hypothetical protein